MTTTELALGPRLLPLDRPRSLLLRLFNWLSRVRFGKVMMPARVIYARLPTLLWRTLPMYQLMERRLSIDAGLRHLIEIHVSTLNGCSFCRDLHRANALLGNASADKLRALDDDPVKSAVLTERERAALGYVQAIARSGADDATFEALRACFSEREIVEITWLQAFVTYLNRMAAPLGIGSDGFCEVAAQKLKSAHVQTGIAE